MVADCIKGCGEQLVVGDKPAVPPTLDLFEGRVVSILSEVKAYMHNTKRDILNCNTEAVFHHTLSDCRSDLAMIQYILAQQDKILVALLDDRDPILRAPMSERQRKDHVEDNWAEIEEALIILRRYQERVRKIDGDAERIEETVQDMLNLKRTYASVQDSHGSVLLSAAAIGFAIVTIVFARVPQHNMRYNLSPYSVFSKRIRERTETRNQIPELPHSEAQIPLQRDLDCPR